MKHDHDNLFLLQDGTQADPRDCSRGKDGVIRYRNGVAVALRGDGEPLTVGENAATSGNAHAAAAGNVQAEQSERTPRLHEKPFRPERAPEPLSQPSNDADGADRDKEPAPAPAAPDQSPPPAPVAPSSEGD
jgi:hypothetical protein